MSLRTFFVYWGLAVTLTAQHLSARADNFAQSSPKWAALNGQTQPNSGLSKRSGKNQSRMALGIFATDGATQSSITTLTGEFIAEKDFANLSWNWSLPPGYSLVSGDLSAERSQVKAGSEISVQIQVQRSAATPPVKALVHWHVFELRGGEKIGDVAQFNINEAPSAKLHTAGQDRKARLKTKSIDPKFWLIQ